MGLPANASGNVTRTAPSCYYGCEGAHHIAPGAGFSENRGAPTKERAP